MSMKFGKNLDIINHAENENDPVSKCYFKYGICKTMLIVNDNTTFEFGLFVWAWNVSACSPRQSIGFPNTKYLQSHWLCQQ